MNFNHEPDEELAAALAALDDAQIDGRGTDDQEQRVAGLAGSIGKQLVTTLNALHGLKQPQAIGAQASPDRKSVVLSLSDGRSSARFGRFEIVQCLGCGGSSLVFRARDPRLGRDVALKIPRAETLLSKDSLRRFLREAEIVAALRHPGIVPVYEAGECDDIPYIVEEFCPGESLAVWMRRQSAAQIPVHCRTAAQCIAQLCDALAYAHLCGIVHRDLKPANIILEPEAATNPNAALNGALDRLVPRIMDFGIARILGETTALTASYAVLGTMPYMPPEQARGESSCVEAASDVYALGVILYELLSGACPFCATHDIPLLRQIVEDDAAPVERLRPDVPYDLSAICMKCLEKDLGRRYRDASELRADLQRFLDRQPVAARPISAIRRMTRWCRRRPVHAALLGLVALSLLCAVGGLWIHLEQVHTALRREEQLRLESERHRIAADDLRSIAERRGADLQWQLSSVDSQAAWQHLMRGQKSAALPLLARYCDDAKITSNFSWRYLARMSRLEERVWELGCEAYWVEFSPDGQRLIAGAQDSYAVMWDVASGSEVFRLQGHTKCVNVARFTSDGRRLWTASCDGRICEWDASNGDLLSTLADRRAPVETLVLSKDGRLLAAGELLEAIPNRREKGRLLLYDRQLGQLISEADIGDSRLAAIDFSYDDTQLAVAADDVACTFNVTHGLRELSRTTSHRVFRNAVVGLPKSEWICWSQERPERDSSIVLQSADADVPVQTIACALGPSAIAVDPAGTQVFVGNDNGPIEVRDLAGDRGGRLRQLLYGHSSRVTSLAVSPNGEFLASAGLDEKVRLWRLGHTEACHRLLSAQGADAVFFVAGGAMLMTCAEKSGIRGYTTDTWQLRQEVAGTAMGPSGRSDQPQWVTCNRHNGYVYTWNALTGQQIGQTRVAEMFGPTHCIRLSANGDRFYIAKQAYDPHNVHGGRSTLEEWQISSNDALRVLARPAHCITDMSLSENLIAISMSGGENVEVIELATARRRKMLSCNKPVGRLTFSPTGALLAATCEDGSVYLWETASGRLITRLVSDESEPLCLAFSPNELELAIGEKSGTVRIWNLRSRSASLTMLAHDEPVRSVAFSPDGWMLATASRDDEDRGEVRVWSAR